MHGSSNQSYHMIQNGNNQQSIDQQMRRGSDANGYGTNHKKKV